MLTIQQINDKIVTINNLKAKLESVISDVKIESKALIEAIPKAQIPIEVYQDIKDNLDDAFSQVEYAQDNISSAEDSLGDAESELSCANESIETAMITLDKYNDEVNKKVITDEQEGVTDEQE